MTEKYDLNHIFAALLTKYDKKTKFESGYSYCYFITAHSRIGAYW